MSKWPGKTIIGLTGNIATGKSVVRRMLEHLGAYGIDADALAHRAIAKGAPGYQPVVEMFGRWVLGPDGEVDRSRLGRVVFSDPQALAALETIVHPLVREATDFLIRRAPQSVVVIEAIKLLETDLHKSCDSIWVTYTPPEIQVSRLVKHRKMSQADARQRILAQPAQEKKLAAAHVVIKNLGSFENTWRQVAAAWQNLFPAGEAAPEAAESLAQPAQRGELQVVRGGPKDSTEIAALFTRLMGDRKYTRADIMAAFGEKAFMLLRQDNHLLGLVGWQVENLIARTTDVLLEPALAPQDALPVLIGEMERASQDLQCEASLIFISPKLARKAELWTAMGYEQRTAQSLGAQAWQEAALESTQPDKVLFFKQLRVDRILRPI